MKIYVGNLDYRIKNEELSELFAEYGTVATAQVIMDRATGRSKGFGFVDMPNDEEAKKAIEELNNGEWVNKKIVVNEARPKTTDNRRGGGGFGGGFNGGGGYGGGGNNSGNRGGGNSNYNRDNNRRRSY